MSGPTVPRETVEKIAQNIKDLFELKAKQGQTQAQLIRWCLMAMQQTTQQAERSLERERRHHPVPHKRIVRMHEPQRKVRDDKAMALLQLEWLATQLENVR
jgi:hypothetical protein